MTHTDRDRSATVTPLHESQASDESVVIDDIFYATADPIRRDLLRALSQSDANELDVTNYVDSLYHSASDIDRDEPASIRVSLHHTHLPVLESAGLIEVDQSESTVTYVGPIDVEVLVDVVDEVASSVSEQ